MKIKKEVVTKEDGRYLIYYTFAEENKAMEGEKDVRTQIQSNQR